MKPISLLASCVLSLSLSAQLYFPPGGLTSVWDTVAPASLGWCVDSIQPLYDHLDANDTKAFMVLKDGKIVLEKYFGTFEQDSLWYWASAGKTLTGFLTGIAQADGLIDINQPTSNYLGAGWTSLTSSQEQQITVRHQLTMTTGLDDGNGSNDCTDPNCLTYLADPGTRWAYHNAPYTLLGSVIENASGGTLNSYSYQKLLASCGIVATYVPVGYNRVVFSTARSFAKFGLLNLAGGVWNGNTILNDPAYVQAMSSSSQNLNNSYGYLWWLNGQADYMLPTIQLTFPGPMIPNAPADMYCGIGKNDQYVCVVPSENIVLVRMGNAASSSLVPVDLLKEIWTYMGHINCISTDVDEESLSKLEISPNPSNGRVRLSLPEGMGAGTQLFIHDNLGRLIASITMNGQQEELDLGHLNPGHFVLRVQAESGKFAFGNLIIR